jgi:hypothetical protein
MRFPSRSSHRKKVPSELQLVHPSGLKCQIHLGLYFTTLNQELRSDCGFNFIVSPKYEEHLTGRFPTTCLHTEIGYSVVVVSKKSCYMVWEDLTVPY